MPRPDPIEDLPLELQNALATIQQYQRENVHGSEAGTGFDVVNYLQLTPDDKYMPVRDSHTRMERTIPGKGTFPMFDPHKINTYKPFPKMLFGVNGEMITVNSAAAEAARKAKGIWYDHPDEVAAAKEEAEAAAPRRKAGRPVGSGKKKHEDEDDFDQTDD